ncbi:MAG TPA: aminodeoxychorismate lyase [Propionibacteriaceae bacterium]|nr:aminodeoxychorismate lyase [Propionibacteriaceae bacterium]
MDQLVAVMGTGPVPTETTLLTADDLGLTRGDGCFDAARVVVDAAGTRVDHLHQHLARFARSASALELPAPDLDAWEDLITEALAAWKTPGEAVLKLIYTRGREHWGGGPTQFLTITTAPDASAARAGVTAITLSRGMASDAFAEAPWLLGGVKTLSYAINVAAKREAARRGVDEAIFVSSDGYLLEAPTAGLVIAADHRLWTTPTAGTGILRSITVEVLLDQARSDGVGVHEALFSPGDLAGADGLWIASAVRGVLPVTSLDGAPLPHDPQLTAQLVGYAGF